MLKFVLRKMLNKKWMALSLLIGNVLMIGIACSSPMYTKAVLQRMLTSNLATYLEEKNAYPGAVTLTATITSSKFDLFDRARAHAAEVPEAFGVDTLCSVEQLSLSVMKAVPELKRDDNNSGKSLSLAAIDDMEEHISIVAGRVYSGEIGPDGLVEVIMSERAMVDQELLLDEVIEFPALKSDDDVPFRVKIVGIFANKSESDVYWVSSPSSYRTECFLPKAQFESFFITPEDQKLSIQGKWYTLLDYEAMRGDDAQRLLDVSNAFKEGFSDSYSLNYSASFVNTLTEYIAQSKKTVVTLWVLQVPIFVLLAAFVFMVSRQLLEMDESEIAVLKSRGAGRRQVIGVYLTQSTVLALIALCAGIPLGVLICQALGSSNAFLEFVRRRALDVEITAESIAYAAAAAAFSVCTMVLPVFKFSSVTIVGVKQKKNRSARPMWQRLYLDVICLGVSLYGLYNYNGQKDLLAQKVAEGASLDPLMFLSSSLFIIGAGLVAARIMPVIVFLVYRLFRRWWSPALYASFLRVLRSRGHTFIVVFLVLTIALGMFNAQAARSINTNEENQIRYSAGADIVVKELWDDNSAVADFDDTVDLVYEEPDFGRFEKLEGVESLAKVYVSDNVNMSVKGGNIKGIQLMGIHTKSFGETVWFEDGLLDSHINNYLNLISQDSMAVLVSANFRDVYGYETGDVIYYENSAGDSMRGVIYGFVDYWPGFKPISYTRDSTGVYNEKQNCLIVAHLAQLQATWGMQPYEIWIKAKGSTQFIYDFAATSGRLLTKFKDADADIVALKNDPVFQGTNGVLTVGFIVVLMLCAVRFLNYWILSIQSRALQFGIFRAMGLSMREILSMLINEHVFISGLSIAAGGLVGYLSGRLFVPLIQLAYAASDQALPLSVVAASQDNLRLLIIIGAMILLCLVILGVLISRMKIAQALKLGED